MRNRVFVFVMLAAVLASMSSCNCGQNRPQKYVLTLEPLAKADEQPLLDVKTPVAIWDDSIILTSAYPTLEGDNFVLVPDDSTVLNGVVHMVYPADAFIVGEGCVAINTVQQLLPMGENMVYYGETTESEPNAVALKAVGGVLRLRLTTPEKLSKVEISAADSNRYMAGVFGVTNYPFPLLGTDGLGECRLCAECRGVLLYGSRVLQDFYCGNDSHRWPHLYQKPQGRKRSGARPQPGVYRQPRLTGRALGV